MEDKKTTRRQATGNNIAFDDVLVPRKNSTSVVWRYFGFQKDDVDQKNTQCKVCRKTIATRQGNTSNLFHHLEHNHNAEYEAVKLAKKHSENVSKTLQSGIAEALVVATPYERTTKRWLEITDAIAYHIVRDMAPIATVEQPGFKRLMHVTDKRYSIPSRKYFSKTAIPKMYTTERERVLAELRDVQYFAATSDLWCSRTTEPYISLTVHFINDKWELCTRVLETAYFPDDHTSEMIAQALKQMISAWDLKLENLVAITTDSGSNIFKAAKLNEWMREQCFGHILHLAIENALEKNPVVDRAMRACKKIVSAFSYSWKRIKALKKAQKELDLPQHKLKTSCPTRWRSMHLMTARLLEQKRAITQVLSEDRASRHLVPTWSDIDVLEAISKALAPLVEFTDALSGEEYVTISSVKPVLHILRSRVLAKEEEDVALTKQLKSDILAYLEEKFSAPTTTELLDIACFVDPRFKNSYISADRVPAIQEKMKTEMESTAAATTESEPCTSSLPKRPKRSLGSFFKESEVLPWTTSVLSCQQAIEGELKSYLVSPAQDSDGNPLQWWREHHAHFPSLSKIAKKYLCVPATSSPPERVFNSGGNIVTCFKSCLKPEMVNMLVFLSRNLK
ncbi:E3 SUMO-protein ligase ZBED1-like [Corythoichthys intestinalis]|uniref:E3 SUMO-protein ligase ZBED1-like n=1 Tax=Corythoichthys intestinalis TaxID=161448 RepID=UPI0025A62F84|nr:E3 SUMO-protein ligase ZBED1-like [Corythoichthys intestinalis]